MSRLEKVLLVLLVILLGLIITRMMVDGFYWIKVEESIQAAPSAFFIDPALGLLLFIIGLIVAAIHELVRRGKK